MNIPLPSSYGAANTCRVDVGGFTFWWSYTTLVAFRVPGHPLVVHENIWTKTTSKHLNLIDGGKPHERVDEVTFARLMKSLVEPAFNR